MKPIKECAHFLILNLSKNNVFWMSCNYVHFKFHLIASWHQITGEETQSMENWSFLGIPPVRLQTSGSASLKMWTPWVIYSGLSYSRSEQIPKHTGLKGTQKPVLPSNHGEVLQPSLCGMSDHHCLPEVPIHIFISNPSQHKNGCLQGLGTLWITSGKTTIVFVTTARLFHGHTRLGGKWINFQKKHVTWDNTGVPLVLSEGFVCFSKVRNPEVTVLYFTQIEILVEKHWPLCKRSSLDGTVHLTELKACIL